MLENHADAFHDNGGGSRRFPVYKIDPAMAQAAKTDKPQWILVSWDGNINQPVGRQQHDAIINNFDFDYAYNFFFDPEKVMGHPCKPLRAPDVK